MKKINILWLVLDTILLIMFNALIWLTKTEDGYSVSIWITYGFMHFAYIALLITPFLVRKEKSRSIFGLSVYAISSVYFLFEFVVGVVFIILNPDDFKVALLVQLIMAALYGILLVSHMIANENRE